jgi:hypothetical protein
MGSSSFDVNEFMSTKALYKRRNDANSIIDVKKCTPRHLSLFLRHGARNPSKTDVARLNLLQNLFQNHSASITNPKFSFLKSWTNRYSLETATQLVF